MASRKPSWGANGSNVRSNCQDLNDNFRNMRVSGRGSNDWQKKDSGHSKEETVDESWNIILNGGGNQRWKGRGRPTRRRGVSSEDSWRKSDGRGDNRGSCNDSGGVNSSNDEKIRFLTGQEAIDYQQKLEAEQAKQFASFDFVAANREADKCRAEFWSKYPKVIKAVYEEHPDVANWPAKDVDSYREHANGIVVKIPTGMEHDDYEINIPNPIIKFEYAFINYPNIQNQLFNAGFEKPSPIQSQAWPLIMQGNDTIGIAQTGTGKTLAFLLPAYVHILEQEKMPGKSPGANVLILAPTRELAMQIHQEVEKFDYAQLRSVCIYGGVDRHQQIRDVRQGCDVIIATPGRLDDLIVAGHIDITTVTFVVLDEADRMLDCGFEPQIRKTMYKVRPDRQTIMTSATWPSGVQRLANSYMKNPVQVIVGSLDLAAVNTVEQLFEFVENDAEIKLEYLMQFIAENLDDPDLKVLVFSTSKATAAFVSSEIGLKGEVSCVSIRGDMDQLDREYSIEAMKCGEAQFLIATDVASRGIDIPNLTHVINFDFPRDIEEYVHRVGRTGRAGKTGTAITYFTRRDARHAEDLIKILNKGNQFVPTQLEEFAQKNSRRAQYGDSRPRRGRYNYNF